MMMRGDEAGAKEQGGRKGRGRNKGVGRCRRGEGINRKVEIFNATNQLRRLKG